MRKRTNATDLPDFDAAPYLDSDVAVAAYLTDILEANDASLLAVALGGIARARGMTEIAKPGSPARSCTRHCGQAALRVSIPLAVSALRWRGGWWCCRLMPDGETGDRSFSLE
jgi:hypothetical protein